MSDSRNRPGSRSFSKTPNSLQIFGSIGCLWALKGRGWGLPEVRKEGTRGVWRFPPTLTEHTSEWPRLDLREGWSLRLLCLPDGPELSGLQGLLSASPGSFPGTPSFTSVIPRLIESGWGSKRASWAGGKRAPNYRGGWGLGPGPSRPTWTPLRELGGSFREGSGAERAFGVKGTREVSAASTSATLRPEPGGLPA